jgi:branched-chain amino acid transport system ATP-binding protein
MVGGKGLSGFDPLKTRKTLQKAQDTLEEYGIGEYASAKGSTLPQGVRKLLDIAMALVSKPSLLLLDEPTSGVAIDEKFALMDTVMDAVARTGSASLFVEHDMEIIDRYATRVIAFYDGHVIADAPTAEALAHPDVRQYIVGAELHRQPAESHDHA